MKISAVFLLAFGLAACGDDVDMDHPDAPVEYDAPPDSAGPAHERAVVVAGDYTSGNPGTLTVIDVTTRTVLPLSAPQGAVAEDPVLRHDGDELLVVNRNAGNSVTILDAATLALVEQLGTGAGSNPQDVAVVGDKLVVATLGNKGAVVLERGSSTIAEIDLSADDPDGKPNCMSVYKVGDQLYVACGLLDDTDQFLPPRGPGKVYVLDATTFAKTATITLSTNNPLTLFEQLPEFAPDAGDLLLPTVDFSTGEGCVERITTSGTPSAAGCVVDNAELGNFASRVSAYAVEFTGPVTGNIVIPPLLYAVVPAADFSGSAFKVYDLGAHALLSTTSPAEQSIGDLVACPRSGDLVVADTKTGSSGLRIYSGGTEQTTAPLTVALKPSSQHGLVCY
jgi:hypothetical protein